MEIWSRLRVLRNQFLLGDWCTVGDFNAIQMDGERKRVSDGINRVELKDFNDFILSMDLVDIPVVGSKFTWFKLDGSACSRLDRFLVSEGLIDLSKLECQVVGDRCLSYHCPIWLNASSRNWSPNTFKLFKCWFDHEKFIPFVEVIRSNAVIWGRTVFILTKKIKILKAKLNFWNKEVGMLSVRSGYLLSREPDRNRLSLEVSESRKLSSKKVWDSMFNSLLRSFLEAPFLLEDVREVMWLSSCDKSPGPDGFSLGFFKKCWVFMKDEVGNFVNEFHKNRFLPKAVTTSFIALIPRTDNPQDIDEFRPICLVGCLYRLISKLLVARLKVVIKKLVSPSQTAFIEGRQMVDGVLVLNEVLDYAKRFKKECLVVKVDFEKDFDCVSWDYLCYILSIMGFGLKWLF
ncbi:uncharacterized protein LOC131622859 [Vicia villosa]|uniref:uncharacterized protein LOC131622859 n=1 Tax=Vicia villosa TaxID=3911 RepID=UPI00273AB4BB|nr:uncharacterized protein LOC131622859 [Vicia villosa]